MSILTSLSNWIAEALKWLGAACLVGMTALTCVDVVGRYMGHPLFGSVELVGFMATLAVAMALPYTHRARAHIGVEIITRLLSSRTRTLLDLVTSVLGLVLFIIITWRMVRYANTIHKSGEVSMNLQLPEHVVIYIVAFCFLITSLYILRDIVAHIRSLRKRE